MEPYRYQNPPKVERPPRQIDRPGPRDAEARAVLGLRPDDDNYYVAYFNSYVPNKPILPGMVWAIPRHPDDWFKGKAHKSPTTGVQFVPGKHLRKLTDEQVSAIRIRSQTERICDLAREFKVTRLTIYRIKKGLTWKAI